MTGPRVYLAARYAQREQVARLAALLHQRGAAVMSSWHDTEWPMDMGMPGPLLERAWARQAQTYLNLLGGSEGLVLFTLTEPEATAPSRGGHLWEAGYAVGRGLPVALVGPRVNVYAHLPAVRQLATDFPRTVGAQGALAGAIKSWLKEGPTHE